ncbi:MAG: response regulator, two-component system [Cyanobacteria bacterium RYN_339]|nr:response regulator, two-component system [Cyanobacteria bacterium RYN_339]
MKAPKAKAHKVLLADPDPTTLTTLAENLRAAGYDVITASDGTEALARGQADQPDIACLEVNLAGTSGLEVCRELKAVRPLPVLLAVSHLDDETSAGFMAVGAEDLLFKPYEIDEVIDKVAWYLNPQA